MSVVESSCKKVTCQTSAMLLKQDFDIKVFHGILKFFGAAFWKNSGRCLLQNISCVYSYCQRSLCYSQKHKKAATQNVFEKNMHRENSFFSKAACCTATACNLTLNIMFAIFRFFFSLRKSDRLIFCFTREAQLEGYEERI